MAQVQKLQDKTDDLLHKYSIREIEAAGKTVLLYLIKRDGLSKTGVYRQLVLELLENKIYDPQKANEYMEKRLKSLRQTSDYTHTARIAPITSNETK